MRKPGIKEKRIPEGLGNRTVGLWLYLIAIALNALLHSVLLYLYGFSVEMLIRLLISFVFFIYPFCYTADALWSMLAPVCRILSGEVKINRKYYMNTPKPRVENSSYSSVTVSVPVYLEDNGVIFETLRAAVESVKSYTRTTGQPAGVIVSDDGLAPLLGGVCNKENVSRVMSGLKCGGNGLSGKELKAAGRILFYRNNGIAFVARPASGRKGLFKKSSNLNYTINLAEIIRRHRNEPESIAKLLPEGAYAEGNIITNDIILLLDKDSGVKRGIIEAIVPEFSYDSRLAYVQCATNAININENYFARAQGQLTNSLFHTVWPCKALQGFFVPLVGHNVFIRKKALEKSGMWSEDKVSEDYDKAIALYNKGWHGKYAQIPGLEFTEYASRTFSEETGRQFRYSYGLFEMIFGGTIVAGESRTCDAVFMLTYFASLINEVLLIPSVLIESYFGNIHLLWAGFLISNLCFTALPCIRGLIMKGRVPEYRREKIVPTLLVSLSFLGHAYSMMTGAIRYITDRFRKKRRPFPSTSVDTIRYTFREGLKEYGSFLRKNSFLVPIAIFCADRSLLLLTRKGIDIPSVITYCVILIGIILVPIFMTPQFFVRRRKSDSSGRKSSDNGSFS